MADNNQPRLGVGIRGAGQVAYEHARAIAANPHLRLAAVASRRRERSEALVRAMAPEGGPTARVYDRYEDMLDDDDGGHRVDLHAQPPARARGDRRVRRGQAPHTREAPCDHLGGARGLRAAARRATTRSVVSFVSRWHPMIRNLRALLDQKAIGDIYYTEVDYWHGIKPTFASYEWIRRREFAGGAMITGGCHAADLARCLKGAEVAEVSAYSCGTRQDFDYPTTLVAAVRFADGTVGKLSASLDGVAFPYQMNIDLLGSKGAIRDNRIYSKPLFPEQSDFVTIATPTINSGAVAHHPFKQEIDNLVENILHDAPVLSDVLDACNSIAISLAIEESAATGKPVAVPVEPAERGAR